MLRTPVEYVADRLAAYVDELWLLGGDPWSYQWLTERFGEKCPGRVHAIDHTITTVGDIPNMMMKALAFVRARSDADFILISQADEVMTAEVATLVREWMTPEHLTQARHCYCQIGFLYQYSATGWGNSIVGRDFAGEFRGDGLGFDAGGHDIGFLGDGKNCYLEIGSLTPEFYFRHQSSHVKTWREYGLMGPRSRVLRKFCSSCKAMLSMVLHRSTTILLERTHCPGLPRPEERGPMACPSAGFAPDQRTTYHGG
jgi:hypothetical protein